MVQKVVKKQVEKQISSESIEKALMGMVDVFHQEENEFYKETVVQTFPNPASDMIVIASEQSIEKVEILNIHGQKLKAVTSASKEISIPIGEMQKGIYIVQAKMTDGRRWTGRFVKQ